MTDSHAAKQLPFAESRSRAAIQKLSLFKAESQTEASPSTSGEAGYRSVEKLTSEMMAVEAQFAGASFQEGKPVCNCDESSHCYRFLGPRSLLRVGSCSPQRTNDSFSFLNPIVTQIPSAPAPRADVVARLVCIQLSNSSPKNGRIGHPKELRVVAVPGCQQGSAFAAFLREPAKLPGCLKLRSFKRSCLSSGEGRKGLRLCPGPYSKSVGPALVAFAPVRNSTEFFYRHTSSWK